MQQIYQTKQSRWLPYNAGNNFKQGGFACAIWTYEA